MQMCPARREGVVNDVERFFQKAGLDDTDKGLSVLVCETH